MNNIFLVHTEYHLMTAIRLIYGKYFNCKNEIFITIGRLNPSRYCLVDNSMVHYHILPSDNYGIKGTVNEFLLYNPDNFICFQDNSSDNIYLLYNMQRANVKTILAQDGYKPYPIWHRRLLPLVIIKETFSFYKQMVKRHSLIPSLFLLSYKYGSLKYIDELLLEYPDALPYYTNKKILAIPDLTEEALNYLYVLFNHKPSKIFDGNILFIGQPLRKIEQIESEINIIEMLVKKYPDKKFYYKPHPLEFKVQLSKVSSLENVILYDKKIPIELELLSIKDGIVISPWSAALLTNNNACRYYWIHRMLVSGIGQMEIANPTIHIKEVSSVEEIV